MALEVGGVVDGGVDVDDFPVSAKQQPRRHSGGCLCPVPLQQGRAGSELLVERMKGEGRYELYRQQAKAAAQCSKPQPAQTVPQPGSMEWFKTQANKD
jgi:hypothetical protein